MNKSDINALNHITYYLRLTATAVAEGRETAKDLIDHVNRAAVDIDNLVRPHMLRQQAEAKVAAASDPRVGASPLSFADRMNDFDARIAALESSVRLHGHRIDAAREAMRECATSDRLHNSVRFVADTLAINLGSTGAEMAPKGAAIVSSKDESASRIGQVVAFKYFLDGDVGFDAGDTRYPYAARVGGWMWFEGSADCGLRSDHKWSDEVFSPASHLTIIAEGCKTRGDVRLAIAAHEESRR